MVGIERFPPSRQSLVNLQFLLSVSYCFAVKRPSFVDTVGLVLHDLGRSQTGCCCHFALVLKARKLQERC